VAKNENGPGVSPGAARNRLDPRFRGTVINARLFDLDGGAGFFQFLLDLFRFLLGDVLLDVLRSAFNEVLSFLQAQIGPDGADFLDDVDLLVAAAGQDNGELGLLFDRRRSRPGPRRRPAQRRKRPTCLPASWRAQRLPER
jgi:hypothetical protein